MRHPTDDQIYDYCHSRLDEVEGNLIARHVEECPACAEKLEEGRRLLTLMGGFSPAAYGAAVHRDILRRALVNAARRAARAVQRRRLAAWAEREAEFAGLVLQWQPGTARAAAELRLVRSFTGSSSWHVHAGAALEKPLNSMEPHGSAWPAASDHIGVLIRHWPERQPVPWLLLARESDPARPEVEVPRRHARYRAPFARFRVTQPGRFILGFEPAPAAPDHS